MGLLIRIGFLCGVFSELYKTMLGYDKYMKATAFFNKNAKDILTAISKPDTEEWMKDAVKTILRLDFPCVMATFIGLAYYFAYNQMDKVVVVGIIWGVTWSAHKLQKLDAFTEGWWKFDTALCIAAYMYMIVV